jgi:S1-C subfamily serine protease
MKRLIRNLPALTLLAATTIGGLTYAPLTRAEVPASQPQITLSFAPVVKSAAPVAVNMYTSKMVQTRRSPFAGDPFFHQFFQGFPDPSARRQNSLGSGVIVSPDGLVISNNHVTEGADEIRVVLNDRREYAAKVIPADAETDLAVLQVKGARGLPAAGLCGQQRAAGG